MLKGISLNTFKTAFAWGNTEKNMQAYTENAFSAKTLLEELNQPESVFYFALWQEQPVGYLKLNVGKAQTDMQAENSLEISRIYILDTFQGHKIGKKLLDQSIEIAMQKKVDFVWLGVWEKNQRAISFYENYGFKKYATHFFMLGDDRQTDILMMLNVKGDTWKRII